MLEWLLGKKMPGDEPATPATPDYSIPIPSGAMVEINGRRYCGRHSVKVINNVVYVDGKKIS